MVGRGRLARKPSGELSWPVADQDPWPDLASRTLPQTTQADDRPRTMTADLSPHETVRKLMERKEDIEAEIVRRSTLLPQAAASSRARVSAVDVASSEEDVLTRPSCLVIRVVRRATEDGSRRSVVAL